MSALAADRATRRSRQQQLEALFTELDARRRELYRLNARGVQRAGLRDVKREFLEVRRQLSDVVAAHVYGGSPRPPGGSPSISPRGRRRDAAERANFGSLLPGVPLHRQDSESSIRVG